jgi:hypothetical protein
MPSWISKRGIWTPAKEKVAVTTINEDGSTNPEIYQGDDRAAKEVLKEQNLPFLGMDATRDPDVIMRARNMNMTVEEFLKLEEPLTAEQIKNESEKATKVVSHQPEKGKPMVRPQGGGVTIEGGFGETPRG